MIVPQRYETRVDDVGLEVFTAVVMKSIIFSDIKLCSPLNVNRTYYFDPEDGGDMFLRNVG
jgi:hypothetical protein